MLLTFLFLWTTTAGVSGTSFSQWVNSGTFVNPKHCEQAIADLGVDPNKARCIIGASK